MSPLYQLQARADTHFVLWWLELQRCQEVIGGCGFALKLPVLVFSLSKGCLVLDKPDEAF